jgi:nicotinamide mononucleotide transporter
MTLVELFTSLNAPLFHVGSATVSGLEAFGFGTGALCVWLVAKQHILNWPIGIANNVVFLTLFATSGLYADAGLQVLYILLAIYGWWAWLYGGSDHASLRVSHTDRPTALALAGGILVGTGALYWVLAHATNSTVPMWDALTTALSLAATYGQTRKQVESWWLWMAADVIYVPLYASKGLWLTAVLYVGFFLLCVNGYLSWRRDVPRPVEAPAEVAA